MELPTLPFTRRPTVEPTAAIAEASLRSDRFRLERETDWQRLNRIVTALERNRLRRLSDEDLLDLPVLYRKAASSLSVARETSLDAGTLAFLESLVRRAWFQVHGPRITLVQWLRRFLGGGWSAAVQAIWLEMCIALATMLAGGVVGYLLTARNEEWFYTLVPGQFADQRQPGATREVLIESLKGTEGADGLTAFATFLFSNNTGVAIMAFALGFAFGMPTILLLVYNFAVLGALLWLYADAGLTFEFTAWLSVHGTTELFAILLAGAAGLHIGRSMAFPGERSIVEAAAESGRRAAQVMAGVVLMLVCAGLLEAFARQLVEPAPARLAIGLGMLAFWLVYLFALRRRPVS